MRIPGFLKIELFYLRILTICTVLSTLLLIYNQVENTSVENTFGNLERQEVKKEK